MIAAAIHGILLNVPCLLQVPAGADVPARLHLAAHELAGVHGASRDHAYRRARLRLRARDQVMHPSRRLCSCRAKVGREVLAPATHTANLPLCQSMHYNSHW